MKLYVFLILGFVFGPLTGQIPQRAEDVSPLLIGEHMPDAVIQSIEGKDIPTSSLWEGKKTILIFYRGSWCPYCNAHLAQVGKIEQDLLDLGYRIVAISPDGPKHLMESIERNHLNYQLYSDASTQFMKAVGLAYQAPERYGKRLDEDSDGKNTERLLPTPALFIVDEKGGILFEYINPDFKVRISAELLMAVAKSLAGS